ncbi:MAG: exodeoxyribonuclease VII large subunit [Candidatus Omnitrophota bacterium]|nr:exodeoxyribonuclease VII large subunit [Candidatus Omnitrophota bacterium]
MDNLFQTEKIYTISELNNVVKKLIRQEFPDYIWVCAEIQDLKDRGTISLNLVQKHAEFNEIVAQVRAVIFENVKPQIIKRIKEADNAFELKKDIEVKLLCKVDLYVKNGQFSLTVVDIDPIYTLGKIAQGRQRIIEELKAKGLLEKNKVLPIPQLPLKIGLITAYNSAAYHDVVDEFKKSNYGFKILVYDSYMQGKFVERDVISALRFFDRFAKDELDVVMIARGGGSTADLSWFDNKKIAEAVAFSKFPVISAIGHEINTSITDMVAHTFVKTPTKGAQFLIEKVKIFIEGLDQLEEEIIRATDNFIKNIRRSLETMTVKIDSSLPRYFQLHKETLLVRRLNINSLVKSLLASHRQQLSKVKERFHLDLNKIFENNKDSLKYTEEKIRLLDPKVILKRGYSITLKDGKTLKSIDNVTESDIIKTLLYNGNLFSRVTERKTDG